MTVRSLLSNDLIRAFSSWCLLAVMLTHPAVPERSYHYPPAGESRPEIEIRRPCSAMFMPCRTFKLLEKIPFFGEKIEEACVGVYHQLHFGLSRVQLYPLWLLFESVILWIVPSGISINPYKSRVGRDLHHTVNVFSLKYVPPFNFVRSLDSSCTRHGIPRY